MKKRNKAISLISLTITIAILIIISAVIIFNAKNSLKVRSYSFMQNDIDLLTDRVNNYYVRYGTLPVKYIYTGNEEFNDEEVYVIDLKALGEIHLNYGNDYENITNSNSSEYSDVYVININTHEIFYAKRNRNRWGNTLWKKY